jgi:hypothetical protein
MFPPAFARGKGLLRFQNALVGLFDLAGLLGLQGGAAASWGVLVLRLSGGERVAIECESPPREAVAGEQDVKDAMDGGRARVVSTSQGEARMLELSRLFPDLEKTHG